MVPGRRGAEPGLTSHHSKQTAAHGRSRGGAQCVGEQPPQPSRMASPSSAELLFPITWSYKPPPGLAMLTNAQMAPEGDMALPMDSWCCISHLCKHR